MFLLFQFNCRNVPQHLQRKFNKYWDDFGLIFCQIAWSIRFPEFCTDEMHDWSKKALQEKSNLLFVLKSLCCFSVSVIPYDRFTYESNQGLSLESIIYRELCTDTYWVGICVKNLVENALVHGMKPINVTLRWDEDELFVEVGDQGECDFPDLEVITQEFVKGNKSLGFSQVEINQTEKAASNLISASQNAANSNTTKEIVEYLHTVAKDKSKFGTPEEVTKLYKLAYDIDSKGNTAFIYANHLYLNNNPEEALKVALPSISKANSKSLNADILRVLTKASIDLNNKENANYYYNYLTKKTSIIFSY